jgi:diguanylate cyclase (GGDEF)-like protein
MIMEERLRELSVTDVLTGIYNRYKFSQEINKEISRTKRYNLPLGLIMFDIDHFKQINDTYGHQTGDEVLKELCSLVKEIIRETDIFARWGGEEFMILCPHTNNQKIMVFAERIRKKIEEHKFSYGVKITISLGVSMYSNKEKDDKELLKRTDTALYKAKHKGRNCVEFVD